MAKGNRLGLLFLMLSCTFLGAASFANAAECKAKTAGFYQQFREFMGPVKLSRGIQGLQTPVSNTPADAARGKEVLTNVQKGNCLSCHRLTSIPEVTAQGGIGPVLDGVGQRYTDAQLRQWVLNPKAYAPKTIMPSYFTAGTPSASVLAAAEVEDLIAYMKTLK